MRPCRPTGEPCRDGRPAGLPLEHPGQQGRYGGHGQPQRRHQGVRAPPWRRLRPRAPRAVRPGRGEAARLHGHGHPAGLAQRLHQKPGGEGTDLPGARAAVSGPRPDRGRDGYGAAGATAGRGPRTAGAPRPRPRPGARAASAAGPGGRRGRTGPPGPRGARPARRRTRPAGPAVTPAATSCPGLSSQFEKATDSTPSSPGASRRREARSEEGRPRPRTAGASSSSTPTPASAVGRSRTNSAPSSSSADAPSSERGPQPAARPRRDPAPPDAPGRRDGAETAPAAAAPGPGAPGRARTGELADRTGPREAAGVVPGGTTRPPSRRRVRSASWASRASCVARTTATPADRAAATTPATADQVRRSWPTVGSSSTSSAGPWATAPASANRRISPPESRCGSASARAVRPRTSSSASTRCRAASSSRPSRRLVLSTSSRTVRETTASSACWGTQPTRAASSGDVHPPGAAAPPARSQPAGLHGAGGRRLDPGQQGGERGLPGAAGADDGEDLTGTDLHVDAGQGGDRGPRRPRGGQPHRGPAHDPHTLGRGRRTGRRRSGSLRAQAPGPARWPQHRRAQPRRHGEGRGRRHPRHPDPLGRQRIGARLQRRSERTVGNDAAAGVEDHQTVDVLDPRLEPVLDQDHGRARPARRGGDRAAYGGGGRGVEHGGGLVEQDQARAEGQHAGERQALGLPAGQGVDRVLRVVREPHRGERAADRVPDPVPRHPEVLGAERDVAAHLPGDRGVGRVLHQQADVRAALAGVTTVDVHRAGQPAGLGGREDPGERAQQRGLARPAGPREQDALAGCDLQADAGQHGARQAGRPPAQVDDVDARAGRAARRRTLCRARLSWQRQTHGLPVRRGTHRGHRCGRGSARGPSRRVRR